MTKRTFPARLAMLVVLLAVMGSVFFGSAHAAAPMVRTTPGYYRTMLGDFEVTALSDGTQAVPVAKLLTDTTPLKTRNTLAASFLSQPYEMSFNAFLINTGHKLILIDTGTGQLLGNHLGKLLQNLEASGYGPGQVDEIYITHMHPDHIGGLSAHGKAVFSNAVVRVNQREADFWLNRSNLDKVPPDQKEYFEEAKAELEPYIQTGRFKPFNGDIELSPGIHAVALFGHTQGHTGYMVESKGKKMLVWGDVVHVAVVQMANPAISIDWDTDGAKAKATRERVLANAARNGWLIAGAHLPFPGLGHVVKDGSGYRWLPVSYKEIHNAAPPIH